MVRLTHYAASLALGIATLAFAPAQASNIAVNNASFETQSSVPYFYCGTGCSFTTSPIVGWTNSGGSNGQFLPGSSSGTTTYFNYVLDGVAVAYTNGGTIAQTLAATAHAGGVYTLLIDVGVRNDIGNPGSIKLTSDGTSVFATGTYPVSGT